MFASARAALQSTKSSSYMSARLSHSRAVLNVFFVLVPGTSAKACPQQRADHRQDRREVEQVREPVTGVGEQRGHVFNAADNRNSPRHVNSTIRISMTTCERVAARAEP